MAIISSTGGSVISGGVTVPFQTPTGTNIISGGVVMEGSTTKVSRRGGGGAPTGTFTIGTSLIGGSHTIA